MYYVGYRDEVTVLNATAQTDLRFIDLFAGIGGMRLALERHKCPRPR